MFGRAWFSSFSSVKIASFCEISSERLFVSLSLSEKKSF